MYTFKATSIVGVAIWLVGMVIEAVADVQKSRFKSTGSSGWIQSGLWKYSRHPNYLGEILVWVGMYAYCFPYLGFIAKIVGALSPILIIILLRFVSGTPILERKADIKWGSNPKYQIYKKQTGLILPKF